MNQDLKVSIIMAVKNTDPYLKACLDSIIAQRYTNWELIAINDHSTDRSGEILQNYARRDPRVKVALSKGQRLIPALQTGMELARGDLINRMDSDDKMPEDKLEVLVSAWLKHGRGTVIAGGTEHFVDEGEVGDGFRRYERWLNNVAAESRHFQEIYQECTIPSHSWIMHREDFDTVGGFDSPVYPEDYDLTFRIYRKGLQVVGVDHILHHWRDRSDRISRTWDEYKDNRYYDLKLRFFYELDRDLSRPLVVWGAGRNGKDLVRLIMEKEQPIQWVCDNEQKIGKDIYGIILQGLDAVPAMDRPQILIAVTSPEAKREIKKQLTHWGKQPVKDFWFFV